jgi:hypothetical protein
LIHSDLKILKIGHWENQLQMDHEIKERSIFILEEPYSEKTVNWKKTKIHNESIHNESSLNQRIEVQINNLQKTMQLKENQNSQ